MNLPYLLSSPTSRSLFQSRTRPTDRLTHSSPPVLPFSSPLALNLSAHLSSPPALPLSSHLSPALNLSLPLLPLHLSSSPTPPPRHLQSNRSPDPTTMLVVSRTQRVIHTRINLIDDDDDVTVFPYSQILYQEQEIHRQPHR